MGLVSIALTVVVSYRFFLFLLEPLIVVTLSLRRDGVQSRTLQPRTQVDSACPHADVVASPESKSPTLQTLTCVRSRTFHVTSRAAIINLGGERAEREVRQRDDVNDAGSDAIGPAFGPGNAGSSACNEHECLQRESGQIAVEARIIV
jgi:hypothetical protein